MEVDVRSEHRTGPITFGKLLLPVSRGHPVYPIDPLRHLHLRIMKLVTTDDGSGRAEQAVSLQGHFAVAERLASRQHPGNAGKQPDDRLRFDRLGQVDQPAARAPTSAAPMPMSAAPIRMARLS